MRSYFFRLIIIVNVTSNETAITDTIINAIFVILESFVFWNCSFADVSKVLEVLVSGFITLRDGVGVASPVFGVGVAVSGVSVTICGSFGMD